MQLISPPTAFCSRFPAEISTWQKEELHFKGMNMQIREYPPILNTVLILTIVKAPPWQPHRSHSTYMLLHAKHLHQCMPNRFYTSGVVSWLIPQITAHNIDITITTIKSLRGRQPPRPQALRRLFQLPWYQMNSEVALCSKDHFWWSLSHLSLRWQHLKGKQIFRKYTGILKSNENDKSALKRDYIYIKLGPNAQ